MTEKKYELTDTTKVVDGVTLHRIRALRDVSLYATAGRVGGWVESEWNLSQKGGGWISTDAVVMNRARVIGDATIGGRAVMRDHAVATRNASVSGSAILSGYATITDSAFIADDCRVDENASLEGFAGMYGGSRLSGRGRVCGTAVLSDDAVVGGTAYVDNGAVRQGGTVMNPLEAVTLTGLFDEAVTLYRARNLEGGHLVTAGCQRFRLDVNTEKIETIAVANNWALPPGWKSLRRALLAVVKAWGTDDWGQGV